MHFVVSQGYFELARARYAMGVHSISPSQFASHLEASRRVGVENNDTDGPFSLLGEEQDLCTSQKGRSMSLSRNPTQSKEGELLG